MSWSDAHFGSITTILALLVTTLLSLFLIPLTSIAPPVFVDVPISMDLGVPCSRFATISFPLVTDISKSLLEYTPPTVIGTSHFNPLRTVYLFLSNKTKKSVLCPSRGTGVMNASNFLDILNDPSRLTLSEIFFSIFVAIFSLPNTLAQLFIVKFEISGLKPIISSTSNRLF